MIKCTGTIETPYGVYSNPDINVYYLSYTEKDGLVICPQIFVDNFAVDQLSLIVFNPVDSYNMNRVDVEKATLNSLKENYPSNEFEIINTVS